MIKIDVKKIENERTVPFNLYDKNGVLICKKGEYVTLALLARLTKFEIFGEKKDSDAFENERAISDYSSNIDCFLSERVKELAMSVTLNCLDSLKKDKPISVDEVKTASKGIVNELQETFDEIHSFEQLILTGDHENTHPINVANISTCLGIKLGLNNSQLYDLGLAAMLHDIGKAKLPKYILNKNIEELNKNEKSLYYLHPMLGYKMALENLGLPRHIAEIILQHHENYNGTGFPKGLMEGKINYFSYIISISSHYDNLVSRNDSSASNDVRAALKIILSEGSKAFQPRILYTFIHMFDYNICKINLSTRDKFRMVN